MKVQRGRFAVILNVSQFIMFKREIQIFLQVSFFFFLTTNMLISLGGLKRRSMSVVQLRCVRKFSFRAFVHSILMIDALHARCTDFTAVTLNGVFLVMTEGHVIKRLEQFSAIRYTETVRYIFHYGFVQGFIYYGLKLFIKDLFYYARCNLHERSRRRWIW